MNMQTVLVTGATGFTGGHLARRLARSGYQVRVLVRDTRRGSDLTAGGIEVVPGDLCESDSLIEATKEIDTVY
ncbi:MAG: NAD(P)H-binding protein, partial [Gammaproteobacteria bacterium]|nr:NAD(P)H-binding protein [Gammaproteobacteria bacterium]